MHDRAILIVEDSYLTAEGYRVALEEAGFREVHLAASGREALRHATRLRPALALLDLKLDDVDAHGGIAVAAALQDLGVPHLIIASGYPQDRVDLRRLARPPAAVLTKPVVIADLVAAVRRCLGQMED